MRMHKNIGCLTMAFTLLSFTALSAEPAATQPFLLCKDSDINHVYKIIQLQENPPAAEAKWFHDYPNQFIEFFPNHTYNFVATKRSIYTPDDLKKAMAYEEEQGFHQIKKYTLDDRGELDLYLGDRVDYSYRCIISAEDTPTTHKNDMTLMGYSKTRTGLNKLFRPWP